MPALLTHNLLHQLSSHHVQRLLRGEPANPLTVTGKLALDNLGSAFAGEHDVHQTNGLFPGSTGGSSHSSDAHSQSRRAALSDSLCHRGCNLTAYCTMLCDQFCGYVCELRFQLIRIDHRSADEIPR